MFSHRNSWLVGILAKADFESFWWFYHWILSNNNCRWSFCQWEVWRRNFKELRTCLALHHWEQLFLIGKETCHLSAYNCDLGMAPMVRHLTPSKHKLSALATVQPLPHSKQSSDAYHRTRPCCHPWKILLRASRVLKITFWTRLSSIISISPKPISEILKHWLFLKSPISYFLLLMLHIVTCYMRTYMFVNHSGKRHIAQFFSLKLKEHQLN